MKAKACRDTSHEESNRRYGNSYHSLTSRLRGTFSCSNFKCAVLVILTELRDVSLRGYIFLENNESYVKELFL
ncbi:hypothetical protein PUN28_001650 [Cardiocondyla obscurior]|uniref:Uncharacterized protein n=1 Tax=Cardiocondyla obscurior TaxID=286306 RepID=A0AAW2GQM1_9HYME